MNGIDTSTAALLASRIGALGPTGSQGSAGTAQTGVSALAGGVAALADPQSPGSPQASAQTVLSAVALALDAIIRSGGDATPAVLGRAPLWADPAAAGDAPTGDAGSLPLPGLSNLAGQTGAGAAAQAQALEAALLDDLAASMTEAAQAGLADGAPDADGAAGAGSANGANGASGGAQSAASTPQGAQAAQGATLAAQSGPVAALAATLAQTVASSGLFYESHLAQWLRGQRTPSALADEPQNRLTGGTQLPLDWGEAADDIDDVLWTELPGASQQGARTASAANAAGATAAGPGARSENAAALAGDAARASGSAAALADTLLPAAATPAGAGAGVGVHEALLPLVRQQLDLLATGEFRWIGEAWPGVRLDWSIQQDDDERRDPRAARRAADDETPWRTRLTLALPALGTVDAELTLAGSTLAVRVQASPDGAQRLSAHGEALRGRIEALGLALAGLSIREIGPGAGGAMGVDGARAAGAYARAAAAQASDASAAASAEAHASHAPDASHATNSTDWELG